jgi:predicted dehydrogenase
MGATIDDEVSDGPGRPPLPYSHAAGYAAADRVDLVAAADLDEAALAEAQRRYDIPRGYDDYREMVEGEEPDILSVATRPSTHAEMVSFAAEHGVPAVYCEKPLCRSAAEADEMVAVCQRNDVAFNLGVNRRFTPLYRRIRETIRDGDVGRRRAITAHCGASAALWGHSHAADMLLFLAGDADAEVVQAEAEFDPADVADNRLDSDPTVTMGYVRFADGTRGYLTQAEGYEFEVEGEDGAVRTHNNGQTATMRRRESGLLTEAPFPEVERRSGTLGCIEELVAALDDGAATSAPVEVAAAGQEVCMGWLASHRRGGERVDLPLEGEDRAFAVDPGEW